MNKTFIQTYDKIAKWFSKSRKNMKWEEINYFLEKYFLKTEKKEKISILDVWCWSWRLLEQIAEITWRNDFDYLWVDSSIEMINEAKINFPSHNFQLLDMENLDKLQWKEFDFVFFIASFHHKMFLKQREKTLLYLKNILKKDSVIFLTNWALDSEINKEKFKNSEVVFTKKDFQNESDFEEKQKEKDFQSKDFSIKFSWFYRYYHCFTLEELDFLFKKADFEIIENRLFDNWRNFISILKNNL